MRTGLMLPMPYRVIHCVLALSLGASVAAGAITPAWAATPIQEKFTFTASDGVELRATVTGTDSIEPRPTLVEFSPYGRNSGTLAVGPEFNTLLVQLRGTGDSDGAF